MTLEGGVLENSMMCLQACASTTELFPCCEEIDLSKRRHATLLFEGPIHDGIACWVHIDHRPTFDLDSLETKMDFLQDREGDGNGC
jgi:hypothetical protein